MSNVIKFPKPDFNAGDREPMTAVRALEIAGSMGFSDVMIFGSSETDELVNYIGTCGTLSEQLAMLEVMRVMIMRELMGEE